jgi:hypothetical protein
MVNVAIGGSGGSGGLYSAVTAYKTPANSALRKIQAIV